MYTVHLAIERGFVCAADLLLTAGCPVQDKCGKTPDVYTRRSNFEFVRKWGAVKEKPFRLGKDLRRLRNLLSSDEYTEEDLKKHLESTKCLDYEVWIDSGTKFFNEPGPLGLSFLETVASCCKSADENFVEWLCEFLIPFDRIRFPNYSWLLFWGEGYRGENEYVSRTDLKMIAGGIKDEGLTTSWLEINWETSIDVRKPNRLNPLLNYLQTYFQDDPPIAKALLKLQSMSQRIALWLEISTLAELKAERIIKRGCTPEEVDKILSVFLAATSKAATAKREKMESWLNEYSIVLPNLQFNVDYGISFSDIEETVRPQDTFRWFGRSPADHCKLYIFLAVQGYDELIRWTANGKGKWDADKEVDAVRIAAYFGNSEVIEVFLESNLSWSSKVGDRMQAAILGVAEAGLSSSVSLYLSAVTQDELPAEFFDPKLEWIENQFTETAERWKLRLGSLPDAVTFGCLAASSAYSKSDGFQGQISKERKSLMKWLVSSSSCDADSLLLAA
jgi:hypothetical protein